MNLANIDEAINLRNQLRNVERCLDVCKQDAHITIVVSTYKGSPHGGTHSFNARAHLDSLLRRILEDEWLRIKEELEKLGIDEIPKIGADSE